MKTLLMLGALLGPNASTRDPQHVTVRVGKAELKTRARMFPGMIMDGNTGMQLVRDRVITLDLKNGHAWLAPARGVR